MTDFRLPQPGERQNAVAIPVPIPRFRALLAAALAWEIDTGAAFPGVVMPQIEGATFWAMGELAEVDARAAMQVAKRLMQDRTEAEQSE